MKHLFCLILFAVLAGCSPKLFNAKWVREQSPERFVARFETSKGNFDLQIMRQASPAAADRFYQLVKHHYYDNALFYRVVPDFVVQFGTTDSVKLNHWSHYTIPDEAVRQGNTRGSLSFARSGKETRGTELFINLKDNLFLDSIDYAGVKGFPAFGRVIAGMEVVEALYDGYDDNTMGQLSTMYSNRAQFLNSFPKLDSIRKAYLVKRR
jgi:homoserine O-acetyltransferase